MAFRTGRPRKHDKNMFPVRVSTMDAELEFRLDQRSTGQELFDLVCRTIGLRETWYFGLQFVDSRGVINWLKLHKRVLRQDVPKQDVMQFMLLVKYFPEDASVELVQDITTRLFFLQVKESILQAHVYCPPDILVHLAAFACQAQFGDLDESVYKPGMLSVDELIPASILLQYRMSREMWEDRIRNWYAEKRTMLTEEAELNYLQLAQDLCMYGVNYFQITNPRGSDLWLGVTAFGLNIYEKDDRLSTKVSFPWSEIKNISFEDRKFVIRTIERQERKSTDVVFYSPKLRSNKIILDLCIGNHDLYMRRRRPDSMELQQMKQQAKDAQRRRIVERAKLVREQQLKQELRLEKEELEQRILHYQDEIRRAREALSRSELRAKLLEDQARITAEEAALLKQKAEEAEVDLRRMRSSTNRSDGERLMLEQQLRDAEVRSARMSDEAYLRSQEFEELRRQVSSARHAERAARDRLLDASEIPTLVPTSPRPPSAAVPPIQRNSVAYGVPQFAHYSSPLTAIANGDPGGNIQRPSAMLAATVQHDWLRRPPSFLAESTVASVPHTALSLLSARAQHAALLEAAVGIAYPLNNGGTSSKSISSSSGERSATSSEPATPIMASCELLCSTSSQEADQSGSPPPVDGESALSVVSPPCSSVAPEQSTPSNVDEQREVEPISKGDDGESTSDNCGLNGSSDTLSNGHCTAADAADTGTVPMAPPAGAKLTQAVTPADEEIRRLTEEIERDQSDFVEKRLAMRRQMESMRREFDELRRDDCQASELDRVHSARQGESKAVTMQKATLGATARRVAHYEEL